MACDAYIIGCGLAGSVIARYLAEELGKKVIIWERRNHIAGNMYDYVDEHGILVHKYGPHTFHTNQKYLFDYMCRFGEWDDYRLTCMAQIDGKFTPTPFNFRTIDDFYSPEYRQDLKDQLLKAYPNQEKATIVELLKHPQPDIRAYAEFLFEKDYSLYTAKQWGISPSEIDVSVLNRVPVLFSYKNGYFDDTYQVMPAISYTHFFENLLNHPNIEVVLNCEALEHLKVSAKENTLLLDGHPINIPVIYTGALDELFGQIGELPYRSLSFEWKYEKLDSFQDAPVVAYPQAEKFTRITEYKKLPIQNVSGTTYAVEYPLQYKSGNGEPYYPVLTEESKQLYNQFKLRASNIKNLVCCGRLADFKYYNMDQALDRALNVCSNLSSYF